MDDIKNDSFWVDWYRNEFTKNMEALTHVETHEQRIELVTRIEKVQKLLKEKDHEFNRFINARQANSTQLVIALEKKELKLREEMAAIMRRTVL